MYYLLYIILKIVKIIKFTLYNFYIYKSNLLAIIGIQINNIL